MSWLEKFYTAEHWGDNIGSFIVNTAFSKRKDCDLPNTFPFNAIYMLQVISQENKS